MDKNNKKYEKLITKYKGFKILFYLHAFIFLFSLLYPIISLRFYTIYSDLFYLIYMLIILLHWYYFNHECIISLKEKEYIINKYKKGDNTDYHPSLCYFFNKTLKSKFYDVEVNRLNKRIIKEKTKKSILTTLVFTILSIYVAIRSFSYTYNNRLFRNTFIIIIIVIGTILIFDNNYQLRMKYIRSQTIPRYLRNNKILLNILDKKTKLRKMNVQDLYGEASCVFQKSCHNKSIVTWKDLERNMKPGINLINKLKPDYIIGIASGGALIASYLSLKTNIPVIFIKAKKYSDNNIKEIVKTTLTNKKIKIYDLSDKNDLKKIKNKKIVLLDDYILSGDSIDQSRNYLKEKYNPNKIINIIAYASDDRFYKFKNKKIIDYRISGYMTNITPYGLDA